MLLCRWVSVGTVASVHRAGSRVGVSMAEAQPCPEVDGGGWAKVGGLHSLTAFTWYLVYIVLKSLSSNILFENHNKKLYK